MTKSGEMAHVASRAKASSDDRSKEDQQRKGAIVECFRGESEVGVKNQQGVMKDTKFESG
jgi:hypothetical protein